ncbi:MAG: ribulose-bisphosphate carboxylase [Rhodothermaceae bacterium]|nr:MAG: ribulose-bisphosphate carboxylase [Rhodothermaceae bacterium]
MATFNVTYHLDAGEDTVEALAGAVLLEQTIETPPAVGRRYPFVREHLMGRQVALEPDPDGGFRATLALPLPTAVADAAQFLNVLFGNSSIHPQVRLLDFEVAPGLGSLFHGPRFGIDGIRACLGVAGRPLTAAALKPVGLSVEEVARLCRLLAEGGVDVIKDDHYLADHPFCPFEARVRACLDAVAGVRSRTGHRALYVPHLSGTPAQIARRYALAREAGAEAVLVAPMLVGLPCFHELTHRLLDVPVLAHPSFAWADRVAPRTLLGKLFRLFGADAVIFTNYGGRFPYTRATCRAIAETLRSDMPPLRPAFPVPAGGMQVERAAELVATFGPDTMLLIGGSLLEAGEGALRERTRAFVESVAAAAGVTTRSP